MQIPGDSRPFADSSFQTSVELSRQVQEPQSIEPGKEREKDGNYHCAEPGGLVVGRVDRKIEGCAGFVPHAAVVQGDYAEAVIARRKIRIKRLPPIPGLDPVAIVAFELVFELILLRHDKTKGGVVDLKI